MIPCARFLPQRQRSTIIRRSRTAIKRKAKKRTAIKKRKTIVARKPIEIRPGIVKYPGKKGFWRKPRGCGCGGV